MSLRVPLGATPEREIFRKRIDDLLDELSRQKALTDACMELGKSDPTLVGEIQRLADDCMEDNAKMAKRLSVLRQFTNACHQTGYRPHAWELDLILSDPSGKLDKQ